MGKKKFLVYLPDDLLQFYRDKAEELNLSVNAYMTMVLTQKKNEIESEKKDGEK